VYYQRRAMATPAEQLALDLDAVAENAAAYVVEQRERIAADCRRAGVGARLQAHLETGKCPPGAKLRQRLEEALPAETYRHLVPPTPPFRSMRTNLAPVPRLTQHRASNGRPRVARRTRRATARAPSGSDEPSPDLDRLRRVGLTPAQRAWLRAEIDRRARAQAKAWDRLERALAKVLQEPA
jgi:hypothetical protein